jgi:hypothetical protein
MPSLTEGETARPRGIADRSRRGVILVQAYFFTEARVLFLRFFSHNFTENGPQDLKMVQKDASRNSTQSR